MGTSMETIPLHRRGFTGRDNASTNSPKSTIYQIILNFSSVPSLKLDLTNALGCQQCRACRGMTDRCDCFRKDATSLKDKFLQQTTGGTRTGVRIFSQMKPPLQTEVKTKTCLENRR
ncbi:hypothetical protein ATANTOWER_006777 [Ataeniobius toweri]|uniref:Uncharacterized protein n=1 Tax=Ataeniobius toweri TaxID=208326 RepID=A0ABU7BX43_9TELE|nr:hypothetical protein [Ataeniobius toweri]